MNVVDLGDPVVVLISVGLLPKLDVIQAELIQLESHRIDVAAGDLNCDVIRLQLPEETKIDAVRNWLEQIALTPVLRVVDNLVLEGQLGFTKLAKISLRIVDSALTLKVDDNTFDISLVVLDQLQGLLEAYIWHAQVIIAAREDACPQQHLLTKLRVVFHLVVLAFG